MNEFQLTTEYRMQGDQPKAVAGLVEGLHKGHRYQTLLGVTGSGKSVAGDEPVTVHLGGDQYVYRRPIGTLIDSVLGEEQIVESLEVAPPKDWRVSAWDARTGQTGWQPITGLSRHTSPAGLYRLTSACGRHVTVTGDHSVWVLRDGHLRLLQGDELQTGDALPIPARIPGPEVPLTHLNLLQILGKSRSWSPGGAADNSPALQRWGGEQSISTVPEGRLRPSRLAPDTGRSAVPPGLICLSPLLPSAEALGYYRPPLRGDERPAGAGLEFVRARAVEPYRSPGLIARRGLPSLPFPGAACLAPGYPLSPLRGGIPTSDRSLGGHRVGIAAATALVEREVVPLSALRIEGKRYGAPAQLEITEELGLILGLYLAEGHTSRQFALFSVRELEVQRELARCFDTRDISFFRRADGDFVVATRLWRDLFQTLMGGTAGVKRLPNCWPALSDHHLAAILRGYFEGDGGVEKDEVSAVTLSRELAADLAEALLRFGIWARLHTVRKGIPGRERGTYLRISVSGAENLARFAEWIGFISTRKRTALSAILRSDGGNTNVDLVFGAGPRLRQERQRAGLSQRAVAERAGCTRTMVTVVEGGKRQPSRALFTRLCQALEIDDPAFVGLARVHWSKLQRIEKVPACERFVYDFSVAGYETFLTGRGGLFVHNTFSMANVVQQVQRPALVIAHNKTLAAQLCSEFREFFPNNAVEYFVSYYDYYQPEAYIPQTDTYIEKDSSINDEINRLRHSATQALMERRDVLIVASVSCIYGLGSPQEYQKTVLPLALGQSYNRRELLGRLVDMQFTRNDVALAHGTFRVKGDVIEIYPADEEVIIRVEFFGDELERMACVDPTTGEITRSLANYTVFPASHFVAGWDVMEQAIKGILQELDERLEWFRSRNQLVEAQRLEQRTRYDLEMMREVGYCNGIENYSRHMDGRAPGTHPYTLLDYFPEDYLLLIDESHQTIPQLHGMYAGDMSRKTTLVDYGFRLPSAKDNRPLRWEEFVTKVGQAIFISATPGPYEKQVSEQTVEQIIRPTGLIDPEVVIRPTKGQIDDLISEIHQRIEVRERVLVTTLTKKMAEDLSEYLANINVKVHYLHSDIKTLERSEILRDLRLGVYDVVVGINLLREGLDLPEVSLVAILDADKEGFLRSDTSLIQTIGRAARNVRGKVLMFADTVTGSMQRAIDETSRRRTIQLAYNEEHGITPATVQKAVRDVLMSERVAEKRSEYGIAPDAIDEHLPVDDLLTVMAEMEAEMKRASRALEFERAAEIRDEMARLKRLLPDKDAPVALTPSKKVPARSGGRGRR